MKKTGKNDRGQSFFLIGLYFLNCIRKSKAEYSECTTDPKKNK